MTKLRCTICANPTAKRLINGSLDDGMTAASISRQLEAVGATVTADTISRHRKHYRDGEPLAPKGTRKADLAILVRDRAVDMFENEELDLRNKDHAAGIGAGLKAQGLLDGREKLKAKTGQTLELLAGLRALLSGALPPLQLDDGNTVEGEAVEVDGEAD